MAANRRALVIALNSLQSSNLVANAELRKAFPLHA
jgi:hypothetical protein